jgi:phosphoribosylaminoimidazole-succinocarboxamide synthase
LRLWFKEHSDPYKDERLPEAPTEMIEEMSNRYIRMYEQITGTEFVKGAIPVIQRLEMNLKKYAV